MPINPDLVFSFLTQAARFKLSLAHQHGLSLREFLILGVIAMQGPITFKQLQELLSIPKGALTGLIDYLHEQRFVDRKQDSEDRRRWFVALTNPGQRLVQKIQEEDARLVTDALQQFDDQDQASFSKVAAAIHDELSKVKPLVYTPPGRRMRRPSPNAYANRAPIGLRPPARSRNTPVS
jgi:DNA-binding MarR family transcriptional regulator